MRRPVQPLVENGGHSSYQEGWRGKGGGWLVAIRGGGEGGRGARSVVDPGATPLTAAPPRRAVTGGRDEEKERKTSEGTPRRCFRGGGGGYPPNRRWGLHDAPHRTIHPRCSLLPPPPPTPPPVYVPSKAASMLLSSHQPAGDPALDPVDDHGRRQQRLPLLLLSCRQWWGRGRPWRRPRRWRPRRGGQRRRQAAGGHVTLDVCFVFTLRSIACGSPTKELFFHRWNQAPPAVRQRGGHSFPVAIDG